MYNNGIGDLDAWSCMSCHLWSSGDVYIFRTVATGVSLKEASDLLQFVKAFGRDQNLRIDVRGAGAWKNSDGSTVIDIVGTVQSAGISIPFMADDATSIAKKMSQDKDLMSSFPSMRLSNPAFGTIAKPNDAIDHWLSLPVMWTGEGLPTASFSQPHEYNLFLGKADDGSKVIPWKIGVPGLGPGISTPGKVPNQGQVPGGDSGGTKPPSGDDSSGIIAILVGATVVGVAGWLVFGKGKKR
jgi:hypothetical protein